MPLIEKSSYQSPFYLKGGHMETIVPSLLFKNDALDYERISIDTPDGDFLDLDFLSEKRDKLLILSHGLEGNSQREYMKNPARYFFDRNMDVLAWNCRTCGGEMNKKLRMYHHGASDDLKTVVDYVLKKHSYSAIYLLGFSMGGSLMLKYLGEEGEALPPSIRSAVAFSVPCHLGDSARRLEHWSNFFYKNRFLKKLKKKVLAKSRQYPDSIDSKALARVKDFKKFDALYTAPIHGFKDEDEFYKEASCYSYLARIKVPTLLVNAKNDPMLPPSCYPTSLAQDHAYFYLEIPKTGGHVGFTKAFSKESWMLDRSWQFFSI